ncbi:alpha/beta fold hydrolase, partial [Micromonospora rubida]
MRRPLTRSGPAAGLAAGVVSERALVRRLKTDPTDPYADEVF